MAAAVFAIVWKSRDEGDRCTKVKSANMLSPQSYNVVGLMPF